MSSNYTMLRNNIVYGFLHGAYSNTHDYAGGVKNFLDT